MFTVDKKALVIWPQPASSLQFCCFVFLVLRCTQTGLKIHHDYYTLRVFVGTVLVTWNIFCWLFATHVLNFSVDVTFSLDCKLAVEESYITFSLCSHQTVLGTWSCSIRCLYIGGYVLLGIWKGSTHSWPY